MRVLHIISGDLWAGAEVQAYTLLVALQARGVEVAAALMNEGELARRLRERGIAVTVLPENEMSAAAVVRALRKLMRAWHPDIVHTHRSKENILGSLANRFSIRTASLRTVHGASEHAPHGLRGQVLDGLNRWTGRHWQQRVVAVSQELQRKLLADFPADRLAVIENGVDVDALRAQVRPVDFRVAAPDATHVGIAGRLVPVKRVDLFIQMAALLRERAPNRLWRFHVFGDGPLRAVLQQQAAVLGLNEALQFHGHRNDIVACIAALDVLVMCSDHEGMPMALLEAAAVGTPICGHDTGGIHELLAAQHCGALVSEHRAEGYAQGVMDQLAQPLAARPLEDSPYTADAAARGYCAVYEQLLAANRSQGGNA
ncbi:MAG: glycosyltransferase [Nevskiaceae bacterium]|jgi:glycosyltransferase involved in cell wall biosynthesis|nr:glycosyltransferase [Nevskiaceae bacterium]